MIWVLLLRGVNVSGANKLPMAEFRTMLTGLGLTQVQTYIQSGNAIFHSDRTAPDLAAEIGTAIQTQFGFHPRCFLLNAAQMAQSLAANPYPEIEDPKGVHLFYLSSPPDPAKLDALRPHALPSEDFTLVGNTLYLRAPEGIGRSVLAEKLGRLLKDTCTARNLRTVQTLVEMAV